MAGFGEQMKTLNQLRKVQKELGKELVEVEAGDGALVIQFNGEMKIVKVEVDKEMFDEASKDDIEGWIKAAVRDGLAEAQNVAQEKMQPLMGGMNLPGMM